MTEPFPPLPHDVPPDSRSPMHAAIDCLTVAVLEVQQLRRRLHGCGSLTAELDHLETTLQELGIILHALREAPE